MLSQNHFWTKKKKKSARIAAISPINIYGDRRNSFPGSFFSLHENDIIRNGKVRKEKINRVDEEGARSNTRTSTYTTANSLLGAAFHNLFTYDLNVYLTAYISIFPLCGPRGRENNENLCIYGK